MNAGEMDKYIMFQRKTETVEANHSVTESWADLQGMWCKFKTNSMNENNSGQEIQTDILTVVFWPFEVTYKDRFTYNGDVYDIQAVDKVNPDYYVLKAKRNEQGS